MMRQTPLIQQHRASGAKLVDFAGWEMPIQYSGVVDEYHTVRSHIGLFDVSHMGRVRIAGAGAVSFLQRVTTNDVGKLAVSQAQYSMVCNENGGIKDDVFVYRLAPDEFLLCVNASNREKILSWLRSQLAQDKTVRLEDRSVEMSQIAVQGPKSRELLMSLGGAVLEGLKLHHSCEATIGGLSCLLARTGYTGELGYEIYIDADKVGRLWDLLVDKGQAWGIKPAGLGARDLLRLEMGYLLYGNDMGEDTTLSRPARTGPSASKKVNLSAARHFWRRNRPESLAGSSPLNLSRRPCLVTDSESSTPGPPTSSATSRAAISRHSYRRASGWAMCLCAMRSPAHPS